MTNQISVYRCTRNECYPQGCLGYDNLAARASHYVNATSKADAMKQMFQMFPHDVMGFTIEPWA